MNVKCEYHLKGAIAPLPGPGFSTPTFQMADANGLWIQDITSRDTVAGFFELSPRLIDESRPVAVERTLCVGMPAIYVFDGARARYVDTRDGLLAPLRDEFERLEGFPRLRRAIGRFVGDELLVRRADKQISDLKRRRTAPADVPDAGGMFIHRPIFDDILAAVRRGVPVVVEGRRGSGKTALLTWLKIELENSRRGVISVPAASGLLMSLARPWEILPGWEANARDYRQKLADVRRDGTKGNDLAGEMAASFVAACRTASGNVTVIIDDLMLALSDGPSNTAVEELLVAARSGDIGLVTAHGLAGTISSDDQLSWRMLEDKDFSRFLLPDLAVNEIAQLLTSSPTAQESGDGADLDRFALSRRLVGFNFREIGKIVRALTQRGDYGERSVRQVVAEHSEATLDHLPDRVMAREVLASIAGSSRQRARAIFERMSDDPAFRNSALALALNGLISTEDGRIPAIDFRHRYIRDWWMDSHPTG